MGTTDRSAVGFFLGRALGNREGAELLREGGRVEAGARGGPAGGAELEVASGWPVGEDADELGEVALGIEVVEAGRGGRARIAVPKGAPAGHDT